VPEKEGNRRDSTLVIGELSEWLRGDKVCSIMEQIYPKACRARDRGSIPLLPSTAMSKPIGDVISPCRVVMVFAYVALRHFVASLAYQRFIRLGSALITSFGSQFSRLNSLYIIAGYFTIHVKRSAS
jgi:hypothetical protein